jgi:hypothetical protein
MRSLHACHQAWCLHLLFLILCCTQANAFSSPEPLPRPMKVLVTGAAGKTGRQVLKKLEEDSRYEPKGLVRTERSAKQLIKGDIHCPLEHMMISDITSPTFEDDLPSGLDGMHAMIICTSAVPCISRVSLLGSLLKAPFNIIRRKPAIDFRKLQFRWKHGGHPEKVDYHGQVAQIKLAKKLGMKQVVLLSSMGGTDPQNFLNMVGKRKDGSGNGDILLWKRKAEMYLVEVRNRIESFRLPILEGRRSHRHLLGTADGLMDGWRLSIALFFYATSLTCYYRLCVTLQSGLDYTIIHPGGLVDTPGGVEEFVLDVDDDIGKTCKRTNISREDVADLCISSLSVGTGQKVSFDCIARAMEDGVIANPKTADEALLKFLEQSKTANYAL